MGDAIYNSSRFPEYHNLNGSPWPSYHSSSSLSDTMSSNSSTHSQNQASNLNFDNFVFAQNLQNIAQLAVGNIDQHQSQSMVRRLSENEQEVDAIHQSIYTFPENYPIRARIFAQDEPTMYPYESMMPVIPDTPSNFRDMKKVYCILHRTESTLYCETCATSLCFDCLKSHQLHRTVSLSTVTNNERCRAKYTMEAAKAELIEMRKDFEQAMIQVAEGSLYDQSKKAALEVIKSIKAIKNALEEKEREMLLKIDNARKQRLSFLESKRETVKSMEFTLTKSFLCLTDAFETDCSPVEFIRLQRRALAEVEYVRYQKVNLPEIDEYSMAFSGRDDRAIAAIKDFATITENTPTPYSEHRPLFKNRFVNRPQNAVGFGRMLPVSPGGRPIPMATNRVVAKLRRNPVMVPTSIIKKPEGDPLALARPWGVACDMDGHIVIADRSNNRIHIYRSDCTLVKVFGGPGTGPLQFDRPAGLVVDARRRIVIADKDNHRIQVTNLEGKFLFEFGSRGTKCGQFNYPWDVATNSECQILVSDTRNHRIQLFSAEGLFLRKYGFETTSSMWKLFDSPRGVAFTPDGSIIVTDFNNHHLLCIDPEFTQSRLMRLDLGSNGKSLQRPQGIVIDDDGNIIVADSKNHRVLGFDPTGRLIWKFGTHGSGLMEMDRPSGIALTNNGNIAVVDFGNNRLSIF